MAQHPLRQLLVLVLASLACITADTVNAAADRSTETAAFAKFDQFIRARLLDSRNQHRTLQAALASAGYEEGAKLIGAQEVKDKAAAKAVDNLPPPAELERFSADLARAKLQAVAALEARADRNERLAAAREKAYMTFAEGLLGAIRKGR